MIESKSHIGQDARDSFADNYPPRTRAAILFSTLIGSWSVVIAAAYLLKRFL